MFIDIRCIVIGIYPAVYMSFFAHSFDEKQTRKHHADLDGKDVYKRQVLSVAGAVELQTQS